MLTGASYAGISHTPDGEQLHLLAVLTQEGRRYWMIYIRHVIEQPALIRKAMAADHRLMKHLLAGAKGHHLRDAQEDDFLAVAVEH